MGSITRRDFLKKTGLITTGMIFWNSIEENRTSLPDLINSQEEIGFGPLIQDPEKVIDLPKGFSYKIISRWGEKMSDGFYLPGNADGMAAFAGPEGLTIVLRNHEVWSNFPDIKGAFGSQNYLMEKLGRNQIYDRGRGESRCLGAVTTFVFDTKKQELKHQFLCLAGTLTNCGGGSTPWNTWITCEEEFQLAGRDYARDHGYAFEVPVSFDIQIVKPRPLKALGRFVKESIAVDPRSNIIYQTEDQKDSLLYRFIPNEPGDLLKGGKLQGLAISGKLGFDTRNWTKKNISPGESFPVEWIDLDNVDSDRNDLRIRGYKRGAALFANGEGMVYNQGQVLFVCTNGGNTANGQVWRYLISPFEGSAEEKKSPGKLELMFEPTRQNLEHPDQMTMSPWGDILVCEDGYGEQYLVGITPKNQTYKFARNAQNESELTGVCFSPDETTMFLNSQDIGLTFAITGPWKQ